MTGSDPTPAIGRIVLYRPTDAERVGRGGSELYPAVITRVWGAAMVNLHVLADAGPSFAVASVEIDGERERSWCWPVRG